MNTRPPVTSTENLLLKDGVEDVSPVEPLLTLDQASVKSGPLPPVEKPQGRVVAVRGAIVDVAFNNTALPLIEESLSIFTDRGPPIIAEVQAHLDERTVRALEDRG